eukprot:1186694-Prorocentrum_minimum.AAC.1
MRIYLHSMCGGSERCPCRRALPTCADRTAPPNVDSPAAGGLQGGAGGDSAVDLAEAAGEGGVAGEDGGEAAGDTILRATGGSTRGPEGVRSGRARGA